MKKCVFVLVASVVAHAWCAAEVTSGEGRFPVKGCAVVYEQAFAATKSDAWGRDAAEDLARILSLVTASEVKAYSEAECFKFHLNPHLKTPKPQNLIFIGRCAAAKDIDTSAFSPCEFRVKVTTNAVFLVGRMQTAASYAMTEFVERFCGYRFLSQNGEDPYDVNPGLTVPCCDFTRKPAIEYRNVYRCYVNRWLDAKDLPKTAANFFRFQRQRRLTVPEFEIEPNFRCRRIEHSDCHNIYKYLPMKKYFKVHPEWYSMDRQGRRINLENAGGQLCFSNMQMRDEFTKNLLAMIEADKQANPTNYARVYDMGQGDSCTQLCFCPECLKIVAKYNRKPGGNWEGGDGGLQLEFANDIMRRVKAKHPEIKLRIFAYCSSEERPKDLAVEPGVIPWFCDLYTFSNHMLPLEHPQNKVKLDNLSDWTANSEYVKIWDYMMYGGVEINADALAADAKLFQRLGVKDVFMESEFFYQPFYDLNMYLMGELYFDPDLDVDKLISRWCRVYGKAAPKMREAIDFIRMLERTEIPANLELWHSRNLPWYTVENFEKFRALCLAAYEMDETPSVRQRIAIAISSADEWLAAKYRCMYGQEKLAEERRTEGVRMTKVWATYELTDPKRIAEVEKKIEKRAAVASIRFRNLPDELKDVPVADLKCLDWHGNYLLWTNNDRSRLEDDVDSETGKAVVKRFDRAGGKVGFPIEGGVYDCILKKVLAHFKLDVPPAARDGQYHWYKLGRVTIDKQSKMWLFGGWGFQCSFFDSYTICDGAAQSLNTFDVWVSVKVPADQKDIRFDRVCLRRCRP